MTDQPTEQYKTADVRAALDSFVRAVYAWGHYSREIHDRCADALELLGRQGAATMLRDFATAGHLDAVAADPFVLKCIASLDAGDALPFAAYERLERDVSIYLERTQASAAMIANLESGAVADLDDVADALRDTLERHRQIGAELGELPAPSSSPGSAGMFGGPPDEPHQAPQTATTPTTPTTDPGSEGTVRG